MKEEYVNCIIIGHSSDDGDDINKLFLDCGADDFEAKPTSYKSLRNLYNLILTIHASLIQLIVYCRLQQG